MTRQELSEALLKHGADLDRWPEALARKARTLVESDPEAGKMLMQFAGFERSLKDALRPPAFGAAEIGAVLAARDRSEAPLFPAPRFWVAGASLSALCFVLGFVVTLAASGPVDVPVAMLGLALGQGDVGGLM